MRMPWSILFPRDVREVPGAGTGKVAREEAERNLETIREDTSYYAGLGDDLRSLRERNHFADNIRATLKGVTP